MALAAGLELLAEGENTAETTPDVLVERWLLRAGWPGGRTPNGIGATAGGTIDLPDWTPVDEGGTMFVTVLRGQIAQENWGRLRQQYERQIQSIPDGLMETFLIQSHDQPALWEIVTFWQNESFFERARGQKKMTACEMILIDAGSVPERSMYQVRSGFERIGA